MFRATLSVFTLVGLALVSATDARADHLETDIVQAYSSNYYTYDCYRGGSVGVALEGDGDTDIDVIVTDSRGNVVASDIDYTDICVVQFFARSGVTYSIEVRNLGSVWNQYEFALAD